MTTTLTDPPRRLVYAVDVLASIVSISRIEETADRSPAVPKTGAVEFPLPTRSHTPATTWHRATTVADEVYNKLTSSATVRPTLVVFSKQQWGSLTGKPSDPTAQRRMMCQAYIEDRLHRSGIPVAEFPYPTSLVWLNGGKSSPMRNGKRSVMAQLDTAVAEVWGIVPPRIRLPATRKVVRGELVEQDAITRESTWRPGVVALCAIGAMSVGIETAVPVTEERLRIVRGEKNQAVQFPKNRRCPTRLDSWLELQRRPEILTVDG
ncbi:Uncharacterised protein [Mycobacteroides abscessus subsp. massiliense]|uniref:hypothetical protein n=1 Tax=Mycobacteroides abscessus TaxID=36809 RepID=UPI0009A7995E|nr:hypothetical protein [Mycobacteroides abscessus]MDO3055622.1 hypothetical protein [Mycobacteroides abscessus subsp. massiliense]SLC37874.1 Uncharacterised protein [Mycobacteroides abscessus subsp. massiliense]SLH30634.1 Uncharacterised protein [Mycobacteroides abscessus subsp. massiliense]SLI03441.1 Uncharacterised protein [Mycobacteroides abscessus subsp. massiliense]